MWTAADSMRFSPNDGASADNSQFGQTDKVYIDCVTLEGKTLWRIDLGKNICAGQHYTQMCVADFDCDGKAELITKTAGILTDDGNPVVTYQLYRRDFAAGETITLGALNQSSFVNYAVAVPGKQAVPGDINSDGACNPADLVMMRKYLLAAGKLTPEQGKIADMNHDGKINAVDFTLLKRILL